jgi:hypothetical protein
MRRNLNAEAQWTQRNAEGCRDFLLETPPLLHIFWLFQKLLLPLHSLYVLLHDECFYSVIRNLHNFKKTVNKTKLHRRNVYFCLYCLGSEEPRITISLSSRFLLFYLTYFSYKRTSRNKTDFRIKVAECKKTAVNRAIINNELLTMNNEAWIKNLRATCCKEIVTWGCAKKIFCVSLRTPRLGVKKTKQ